MKITSTAQIPEVIHEAAEQRTGITARSSVGRQREGRSEAAEGGIALDLSGLDCIININKDERVAIVEPGVTYSALDEALKPLDLRVCHPLLPPKGKSVLASILDREPQLVPKYHWDFTDPLLCAEIYFGTGERFRTGGAAGPGKTLEEQWSGGMFQKNPLGPAQTDLIKLVQASQGTMGIATWASVRLECRPEIRRYFTAAGEYQSLAKFVSAVTRRRLGDEIALFDAGQTAALVSVLGHEPVDVSGEQWLLALAVGSLPFHAEESIDYQLSEIRDLAKSCDVNLGDDTTGFVEAVTAPAAGVEDWKRAAHGDFTQIYFLSTLDRAEELVSVAREAWSADSNGPAIGGYVQPLNHGRTCHVEITASGVRPVEEIAARLADAGAFFSRPAGETVPVAYGRCPDTVRALRKVKTVLDPPHVLNPGRLFDDPRISA